jgi:hypothetical protein
MNVDFEYRYRDFGNNKRYGAVVFGNRTNVSIDEIRLRSQVLVGDDMAFSASWLGIPEMFFPDSPYDPALDWDMHEFCDASATDSPINDAGGRDVAEVLSQLLTRPSIRRDA